MEIVVIIFNIHTVLYFSYMLEFRLWAIPAKRFNSVLLLIVEHIVIQ